MSISGTHDVILGSPGASPVACGPQGIGARVWYLVTRHLLPAQFTLVVLLLALSTLFERWFGGGSGLVMAVFWLPVLALSTLAFVLWALVQPTRAKLGVMACGLGVALAFPKWSPYLSDAGRWLFFETRRARLESLAHDVVAYGRIEQMTDGLRYYKELNHQLVAYTATELQRVERGRTRRPLAQVLEDEGISPQRYEEFRARLRDVKLIELEVQPNFIVFEYDGLVDNLEGYLLLRPGGAPPALGAKLLGTDLVLLEPLGGGWYRWATT